jgi:hypothetical protein
MLTQVIPSLIQAMSGNMPEAVVRQLAQTLGNCNQPLQHRGAVSVTPTPARPAVRGGGHTGTYGEGGVFGDEGSWNPTNVFRENFSTLHNNFVYNNYQNQFLNETLFQTTIDSRAFSTIFNTNDIYNNNSFVDASSTNNHFGGDNFAFNNSVEFITNNFPVEVIFGVPGAPGPPGPSGFDGLPGTNGVAGRDGLPGRAGLDGRDGFAGRDGFDGLVGAAGVGGAAGPAGQPGRPGIGFPGRNGPAGRDGRDGRNGPAGPPGQPGLFRVIFSGGGGYELKVARPVQSEVLPTPKVQIKPVDVTVPVPRYKFDAEQCSLVPDGVDNVTVSVLADVSLKPLNERITLPGAVTLAPKATYP